MIFSRLTTSAKMLQLLTNTRCVLMCFLLVVTDPVYAIELFPEYSYFNPSDSAELEGPERIDGEYFSDTLTFRRLLTDPAQRWTLQNRYDLAIGSLSGKEFFENQTLFVSTKMAEALELRLIFFRDRDFEQSHSQFTMELIYWLNTQWGLAVNGSPSYDKSDDDIGLALIHSGFLDGESRLFVNFPNFQLDKRSAQGETWSSGRAPMAMGLVSRSRTHEVAVRHETATELNIPIEQKRYSFKRTSAQAKRWWDVDLQNTVATQFFYENKAEGQSPTGGGTVTERFLNRDRFSARLEWSHLRGVQSFTSGLSYEHRRYAVAGESLSQNTILPYAWWALPWKGDAAFEYRVKFGADTAFFDSTGPVAFVTEPSHTYRIDMRGNIVLDMKSSDKWSLNFLFTFDADLNDSDTLWEGGAAQFRIYF